jgi:hypothetical protein
MKRKPKPLAVILVLLVTVAVYWLDRRSSEQAAPPSGPTPGGPTAMAGDAAIEAAFKSKRSKVWVESEGVVSRILDDDRKPPRHQKFLLRIRSGQTLKVAHNVDLAPKVPLREGDRIRFRGRYEYNDRGGVLHWTHRDPRNPGRGGWLEHAGKTYR